MKWVRIKEVEKRITEAPIYPPEGMTADELSAWLKGYGQCVKIVKDILDDILEDVIVSVEL